MLGAGDSAWSFRYYKFDLLLGTENFGAIGRTFIPCSL